MNATPMSPRVRRLRSRCLGTLAGRRGLPVPADQAFADGRESLTLAELLGAWEQECRSRDAHGARGRRWRRRPAILYATSALVLGAAGVAALVRTPSARRPPHPGAPIVWTPVGDSAISIVRAKLLRAGETSVPAYLPVTATDLAALAFAEPSGHRWAMRAGLTARVDSALWLRGTANDGRAFTIAAGLRVMRPGVGELRVLRAELDSGLVLPFDSARARLGTMVPLVDRLGRSRFRLPRFVRSIELRPGGPVMYVDTRSREQDD